jgi:hypothetical protein
MIVRQAGGRRSWTVNAPSVATPRRGPVSASAGQAAGLRSTEPLRPSCPSPCTEAFLKERQVYLAYDEQDVEDDRRDLDRLGSR